MTPWLILGAGYTGMALARALVARGDASITITRRDGATAAALAAELAAELGGAAPDAGSQDAGSHGAAAEAGAPGVRGAAADLADAGSLVKVMPAGAIVVCCAPPGADPAGELRGLIAALVEAGARKLIYISSTGVYGPGHGAWVDETWPLEPATQSGRARAAAESALVDASLPWVALRAAGIYGPGRGLAARVRAGTYRIVGDGTSHVGRIHVDDLVAAILAAAASPATGAINAADDDPSPIGSVADAIAARLGLPPPPRVPVSAVSPEIAGMLTADRKLVNRRLRDELGVQLRYPSWRDALDAELR